MVQRFENSKERRIKYHIHKWVSKNRIRKTMKFAKSCQEVKND
jgi:hypothetical protein